MVDAKGEIYRELSGEVVGIYREFGVFLGGGRFFGGRRFLFRLVIET